MPETIASFDERELIRKVTVTISIKRHWRVRIGMLFVRFGQWLAGFGMKVVAE